MKDLPIFKQLRERPPTLLFLLPIIVFAVVARFYGIDFGFPDLLSTDEPFEIHRALRLANGDFDFGRAGKGGLYYILFIEMGVTFFVLYLFNIVSNANQFAIYFIENEHYFYLMGRITCAVIGVLSVYVIYIIGREIGGKKTGIIAAFLLSICPLHIINSHYSAVDVLMLFFMLLTWLNIYHIYKNGEKKYYIKAGIFFGLSVITKLPAILIIIPIVFAHFLRILNNKCHNSFYLRHKYLVILFIIFIFVTAIGEPGYFKNNMLIGFVKGFSTQKIPIEVRNGTESTESSVQVGEAENLYLFYFKTLKTNIGLLLLITFVISLSYLIIRKSQIEYIFLSFLVPYIIAICSTTTDLYYKRYLLPIIPIIFLITAKGITSLTEIFSINKNETQNKILILLFTTLICCPIYWETINSITQFLEPNTRILAKQWINENIQPNSKILMEDSPEHRSQFLVPVVNSRENVEKMIRILRTRDPGKAFYWEKRSNYLDKLKIPRYDINFIRGFHNWPTLYEIKKKKIEYVIINTKVFSKKLNKNLAYFLKTRIEFYNILKADKNSQLLMTFSSNNQSMGPNLAIYKISYK